MCYTSKTFRKENYFVLYDMNDNIVCYFDNFEELSKQFNYRLSDLVYQFNRKGSIIDVIINNKYYKLCTFVD